jgi:hypothetical protein
LPLLIDFESDISNWTLNGTWGITSAQSHSPTKSLTESPSGNYGNNQNISATFGPVSLLGYTSAQLSFWTKYDLETNYDYLYVEVSNNNQTWTLLERYSGNQASWTNKTYPLNSYLGNAIYIRFRFTSDGSVTKDGFYMDDFAISVTGTAKMQPLKIYKGWSGISSYLSPFLSPVSEILQPITSNLVVLQDEANSYWPAQSVNTLGNWNSQTGYKIKVSHNSYLRIPGSDIENQAITLTEGWNILPVLSTCPVECGTLFSQIPQIQVVKEIASTRVYWLGQGIESLQNLLPGVAYHVYASAAATLNFPECNDKQYDITINKTDSPWETISPTGNSHLISIPNTVLQNFTVNDKIGVFTPNGKCAGLVAIENLEDNVVLVAFENDSLVHRIDGFVENNPLSFRLNKNATGEVLNLAATFDNTMPQTNLFHPKGLSAITNLVPGSTGIQNIINDITIFPNPAKSSVLVELSNNQQARLEIISPSGQVVETLYFQGISNVNVSVLPKGVYLFRITGESVHAVRKVVIQ